MIWTPGSAVPKTATARIVGRECLLESTPVLSHWHRRFLSSPPLSPQCCHQVPIRCWVSSERALSQGIESDSKSESLGVAPTLYSSPRQCHPCHHSITLWHEIKVGLYLGRGLVCLLRIHKLGWVLIVGVNAQ